MVPCLPRVREGGRRTFTLGGKMKKHVVIVIFCILVALCAADKRDLCPDVVAEDGAICTKDDDCKGGDTCCTGRCASQGNIQSGWEATGVDHMIGEVGEDMQLVELYRSRPKRKAMSGAWDSIKELRKASRALRKKQRQIAKAARKAKKTGGADTEDNTGGEPTADGAVDDVTSNTGDVTDDKNTKMAARKAKKAEKQRRRQEKMKRKQEKKKRREERQRKRQNKRQGS